MLSQNRFEVSHGINWVAISYMTPLTDEFMQGIRGISCFLETSMVDFFMAHYISIIKIINEMNHHDSASSPKFHTQQMTIIQNTK